MLEISDEALIALRRDYGERMVESVATALRDACPEDFIALDDAASSGRARRWISYVGDFEIYDCDNIVALYGIWKQWSGFSDNGSKWILEILRGRLPEDEKIASLNELMY